MLVVSSYPDVRSLWMSSAQLHKRLTSSKSAVLLQRGSLSTLINVYYDLNVNLVYMFQVFRVLSSYVF